MDDEFAMEMIIKLSAFKLGPWKLFVSRGRPADNFSKGIVRDIIFTTDISQHGKKSIQ